MVTAPELREDLYSKRALHDPYPFYRQLRDLGPAVWMPRRKLWAIARYDDVRSALRADQALVSAHGVAANGLANGRKSPITLTSDGEDHLRRRRVLAQPVMPGPLKELRPRLEAEAAQLVNRLKGGGQFDAMSELASHLPVTIVAELVGLDEAGRRKMLRWAAATFNVLGVMNGRGVLAVARALELLNYIRTLSRANVTPGGWAVRLFDAADTGAISAEEARAMIIDYVAPALDTTILATGHMLWRLAITPGAYESLRAEPELIPSVVNESVRLASPIRGFTRLAAQTYDADGVIVPQGARVLMLFASGNRDERHYENPDRFDIRRNPRDHLAWGHGPHTCVGMHLARLEMEILLGALVAQVETIEVSEPEIAWNNVLQGFKSLPCRLVAA